MERIQLQYILFGMCTISGLVFIIYLLKSKDDGLDYDKIIAMMKKQTENNLNVLKRKNKEINEIEEEILICKKELGTNPFKKG